MGAEDKAHNENNLTQGSVYVLSGKWVLLQEQARERSLQITHLSHRPNYPQFIWAA